MGEVVEAIISNERDIAEVDHWIKKWKRKFSFVEMLNDINGYTSGSKKLKADAPETKFTKAYRKAALKIHPDRMIRKTFKERYKAQEQFKIISHLYSYGYR